MSCKFPILMNPYIRPAKSGFLKLSISEETKNIIDVLYGKANQSFVSGMRYRISNLENSLFCCCFPEGLFIYAFFPEKSQGQLAMAGFFISQKYMRIAWRLYLEDIMYIVAANMCSLAVFKKECDYDTMRKHSEAAKGMLNEEYRSQIAEYLSKMNKDIPYNFAMTQYPKCYLPVNFNMENSFYDVHQNESEEGNLVIYKSVVEDTLKKLGENEEWMKNIYIRRAEKSDFLEIIKARMKSEGKKKADIKAAIDDTEYELNAIRNNYVWYMANDSSNDYFIRLFDYYTNQQFQTGSIDFAALSDAVEITLSQYRKEQQEKLNDKDVDNNNNNNNNEEPKRGFLKLFRK